MHSYASVLAAFIGLVGVAQAGSSSCVASNKKAIAAVRFRFIPTAISTGHTVSSWSDGGGHRATITADAHPFAGREYAGGNRGNIIGSKAYGSGYSYGASDVTTLKGRPFPHVMWPISWGPGYMGGDEYWGSELDLLRPGGGLGILNVSTTDTNKWPRVGSDEIYTMIGDKESLMFMISDLVRVCHAVPAMPRKFDPTTTTMVTQPRPENVIQYYRSSSFALTYAKYNNTFALPSSNPTTNHGSVPLPASIIDSAFLRCVNDTIRASLPLMDPLDPPKKKLSPGAIAGICVGSIFGAIILFWCCCLGPSDSSTPPTDAPTDATTIVPNTESEQVTPEDAKNASAPELSPAYNEKNDEVKSKKQEEDAKEEQNVVWV